MGKVLLTFLLGFTTIAAAQPSPDLAQDPTLFLVGYAHLDTQWRWEYPQVIREYLPSTMHDNFALFEKYPHYVFNFSGANRYRLMKEYYPADYEKLKHYVATGQWFPAGSSMEESDVNSPSAESIFRQVLYGNQYFRRDFGKASAEYMLPDCFGFPASLPSILAHAGIKGFSTQKLTWGSAAPVGGPDSSEKTPRGTPFNVGIWEGPDGKSVLAALNPGDYSGDIPYDLRKSLPAPAPQGYIDWPQRVQRNGQVGGLFTDYHYYGTGDIGGAPRESSVRLVEAMVAASPAAQYQGMSTYSLRVPGSLSFLPSPNQTAGDSLRIISSTAEQMFLDIKPSQTAHLPRYQGELELTNHSAGSLTSQAYQKRWNRKNELLADAAERASVAASWMGQRPYPQRRLNDAWALVMGGQFHDIMAGTATPKAYEYSWNDDVLAMNLFASVLTSATEAIASQLDTQGNGNPIVVYNPLNIPRDDVAEARLSFLPRHMPASVRVSGPDGREVPAQMDSTGNGSPRILFLAHMPATAYAVYHIRVLPSAPPDAISPLRITQSSLENARYRIQVNDQGDLSSIFDKILHRELLSAPLRLAFQTEKPHDWPAWNMDWSDQQKPPRAFVSGTPAVRIVENGPVRVTLEVSRQSEGSRFVQTISLSAGDAGNRVEFGAVIDWKTPATALKATFSLTAANPLATYNWDIGTVQRGNNDQSKFEVASHQWFDLSDTSGAYGVTILSDCKYGSDKPGDHTLRLTLLYTPGLGEGNGHDYSDQTTQDWGRHEIKYGLAAHGSDWRQEQTDWQALRLNQPLMAFTTSPHQGGLGKSISLLHLNSSRVRVLALKKAEQNDDLIVRLVEMDGRQQSDIHLTFIAPVTSAVEVDAQERTLGPAATIKGDLVTSLGPYQPRTFALKLARLRGKPRTSSSQPVALAYDLSVAGVDGEKSTTGFDSTGGMLPAEMLPAAIEYGGIQFVLAPSGHGQRNAMVPRGQTIPLPPGKFNRLYLLAAAAGGDQRAVVEVEGKSTELIIQDWSGFIGQWDTREWKEMPRPKPANSTSENQTEMTYAGLTPGFIKRAPVAWFASHRHNPSGSNEPYAYSYLFGYQIDVPANAKSIKLPANDKIRIMAITTTQQPATVVPAHPLYDVIPLRTK